MSSPGEIKLGIVGAMGRMGRIIASLAKDESIFNITALYEHPGHAAIGMAYNEAGGHASITTKVTTLKSGESIPDVIIDFSLPDSTMQTIDYARKNTIALVIGTTGFTEEQETTINETSKTIPVMKASNMAVGVNLLFALTRAAAKVLNGKGYHPEIVEAHHRHKKDAPSGTARTLERVILEEFGWSKKDSVYGREGITGERPDKQLGVMTLRGGDVVGDHSVYFFGEGERLEIKHQAHSRNTFAAGSLTAARFICEQKPGLYNMQDVLNLFI